MSITYSANAKLMASALAAVGTVNFATADQVVNLGTGANSVVTVGGTGSTVDLHGTVSADGTVNLKKDDGVQAINIGTGGAYNNTVTIGANNGSTSYSAINMNGEVNFGGLVKAGSDTSHLYLGSSPSSAAEKDWAFVINTSNKQLQLLYKDADSWDPVAVWTTAS